MLDDEKQQHALTLKAACRVSERVGAAMEEHAQEQQLEQDAIKEQQQQPILQDAGAASAISAAAADAAAAAGAQQHDKSPAPDAQPAESITDAEGAPPDATDAGGMNEQHVLHSQPQVAAEEQQDASTSSTVEPPCSDAAPQHADGLSQPSPPQQLGLQHVLSVAAAKRGNLYLLDDKTLVMAAGCVVLLLHVPSGRQRYLPARDGGGIGALAVHAGRQLLLVAEKCRTRAPNMWVSVAAPGGTTMVLGCVRLACH
jgi:hypothetical protein